MKRISFLILGILLVSCGGGGGGGGGGGDGSNGGTPSNTPMLISSGLINAGSPMGAVDSNGNAIVVWNESEVVGKGTVSSNIYKPGIGWGNSKVISYVPQSGIYGTSDPKIAMNLSGVGVAIWNHGNGTNNMIYANFYLPSSGWGTPILISNSNTTVANPSVAIDGNGNAIAVWDEGNIPPRNIYTAMFMKSNGWQQPLLLSTGQYGAYYPRVSMNESGNAVVSYQETDGSRNYIKARRYVNGVWGSATVLSGQSGSSGDANAASASINSKGNIIVAWQEIGYKDPQVIIRKEIFGSVWINGNWRMIGHLSIPNITPGAGLPDWRDAISPYVCAGESDKYYAIFEQDSKYEGSNIYINDWWYNAPGGSGPEGQIRLSDGNGYVQNPKIALSNNGKIFAVWEQAIGSFKGIYMNKFDSLSGKWDNSARINNIDRDANSPFIATDLSGNSFVVWSQNDGVRNNIYARIIK